MNRAGTMRTAVQRLIRAVPFQPFVLTLESGDRVLIEHPENIAFDPGSKKRPPSDHFFVLTRRIRLDGTFSAITSVVRRDRGEIEA